MRLLTRRNKSRPVLVLYVAIRRDISNAETPHVQQRNLCKNAVDAMGGEGKIDVTLSTGRKCVYIDVADTGKGIARKEFENVFKPGYTTKKRGWGLGLTLAKRIVEEYHNGAIYVKESEPGVGTTFRIELPRVV
ncbi:MAG: ATP-binding protein [Bacteroidaceae bacterium]|nr:ATP-binding protein [Bacteroidaceae bacterium]